MSSNESSDDSFQAAKPYQSQSSSESEVDEQMRERIVHEWVTFKTFASREEALKWVKDERCWMQLKVYHYHSLRKVAYEFSFVSILFLFYKGI